MTPECLAEALLQQSPALSWLLTDELTFYNIYGNPRPYFGTSAPELIGKSICDVVEPELSALWRDRVSRARAGESFSLRERLNGMSWYTSVFPVYLENRVVYTAALSREATGWERAEQELRNTVLGALRSQEFEKNTLSRFLHDQVGQNFTALGLQLDLIRMDLESTSPDTCSRIVEIQKVLGEMMEQVREYSYALNPSIVERTGLRSALDRLATRLQGRFSGSVRLNVDPSMKIDKRIATAMYHIAEEALANAVQHAGCSAIEIAVKSSRTGASLEIRDNGRGFDPADLPGGCRGLGLLSMEHYAAEAGLDLSIASHRGLGTAVRAAFGEN
jgi:signal transduction histidine kinase